MKYLIDQGKKTVSVFGLFLLWFVLSGVKRGPGADASNLSTSDLAATNILKSMPPISTWPLSFWITLFFMIFGGIGTFYGIRYLREKQAQEEMDAIVDEQAQLGLETELETKKIEQDERDLLVELCATDDPVELLPVVSSSEVFEEKVEEYKSSERFDKKSLKQIYDLRRHLEFSFRNFESPFLNTQMLEKGQKLECELRYKSRNVIFITSILEANENHLYIKPPTVKRRPANLKQFPFLHCRIQRANDAEYEFDLKIVDQLIDEMNAVVLEQTSAIRKMTIRESERVPMEKEMQFQRVSEAQYDLEQKFEAEQRERDRVTAMIKDMSAGGMKLQVNQLQGISKSDVLVFHLPQASMRRDLAASVMNIVERGGLYDLHMKFRDNDTITRMKINQYLHRVTKNMEAMAS